MTEQQTSTEQDQNEQQWPEIALTEEVFISIAWIGSVATLAQSVEDLADYTPDSLVPVRSLRLDTSAMREMAGQLKGLAETLERLADEADGETQTDKKENEEAIDA